LTNKIVTIPYEDVQKHSPFSFDEFEFLIGKTQGAFNVQIQLDWEEVVSLGKDYCSYGNVVEVILFPNSKQTDIIDCSTTKPIAIIHSDNEEEPTRVLVEFICDYLGNPEEDD